LRGHEPTIGYDTSLNRPQTPLKIEEPLNRYNSGQTAFQPPQLHGLPKGREILQPHHRPILHRAAEHSTLWTRARPRRLLDDHLHGRRIGPSNLNNAELVLKTEQH
jgi:hypothetical protein